MCQGSSKAINRKTLEALVHSGSFDEFGEDRAVLLASLDVAIEHAQLFKANDSSQVDLFPDEFHQSQSMFRLIRSGLEDKLFFEKEAIRNLPF